MNAVSRALRFAREAMRLDQETFSALLDVDVAEVQAWEAGTRDARSSLVVRCARALALTVEEVLAGELGHASVPGLFLRATRHDGRLSDVLALSSDLALFVEVARALDRLQLAAGEPAPLPAPPVDAQYGTGEVAAGTNRSAPTSLGAATALVVEVGRDDTSGAAAGGTSATVGGGEGMAPCGEESAAGADA